MSLDAVTLIFAIVVVKFVAALLLILVWQVMPHQSEENRASVLTWSICLITGGVGTLIIAMRQDLTEAFSIILGNCFLLIGIGLGRVAVSTLWNLPRHYWAAVVPGLLWVALCQVPDFYEFKSARALYVQVGLVAIAAWTANLCFRHNANNLHTARWLGIVSLTEATYHAVFAAIFHVESMSTLPDLYVEGSGKLYLLLLLITTVAKAVLVFAVEIEKQQDVYRVQATRDPLTGLSNRRAFFQGARQWMSEQGGWPKPYAVLMLDVDHFKRINDEYGHSVGDEILRTLGQICTHELRVGSIAGRIGGEEFALFFPDCTPHKAMLRAERIRRRFIAETQSLSGGQLTATLSGGLFTAWSDTAPLENALTEADSRLYSAKRAGRNRIIFETSERQDVATAPEGAFSRTKAA
ncbi:GGDEF domain-containing protein [Roseibium sp.]|uniref:GGDEF domain-containing protein n=1 Tax=Roseibium sp. TaxID=1936156 RepID=UPI003A97CE23